MKPHKHSELIKAWADGATIEVKYDEDNSWVEVEKPEWNEHAEYRLKLQAKPDIIRYIHPTRYAGSSEYFEEATFKIVIDGETGEVRYIEDLRTHKGED